MRHETYDGLGNLIDVFETLDNLNEKTEALERIAKKLEQAPLTVNGFTESFTTENYRHMKDAYDLLVAVEAEDTYEIMWNGVTPVSKATMRDWLVAGGMKRNKRFNVQGTIDPANYTTFEEMEAAYVSVLGA